MAGEQLAAAQQRGRYADIVDEAIAAYDTWFLDDDYEAGKLLRRIIERMRERRDMAASGEPSHD